MSNMSLYNLTRDFAALMDAEGDEEITNALIDISAGEIKVKAENYCQFLASMESTIEQFKAEEKRIASARKSIENKVAQVRERMKDCLLAADIYSLSAGTFKISVAMTGGSVVIDDMESIPARYLTVIPEQYIPDKMAIKAAIKAGEPCNYAHIEANTSLRIR